METFGKNFLDFMRSLGSAQRLSCSLPDKLPLLSCISSHFATKMITCASLFQDYYIQEEDVSVIQDDLFKEMFALCCCNRPSDSNLSRLASLTKQVDVRCIFTSNGLLWKSALLVNAIWSRNNQVIRLLLSLGFDPNSCDGDGTSALSYACTIGDEQVVEWLLMKGANPYGSSFEDSNGPIHCAAQNNNIHIASLLIRRYGCTLFDKDVNGHNTIFTAIEEDHLEFFKWATSSTPSMFFKLTSGMAGRKRSMLMHIFKRDAVSIFEWLCTGPKFVNPLSNNCIGSSSALQIAALYGSSSIIQYLLSIPCIRYDSLEWIASEQSPWQLALQRNDTFCYELLCAHEAKHAYLPSSGQSKSA